MSTDDQTMLLPRRRQNTLLGGEGTTFDQMIDSFPLAARRARTFLTGQYAHNHGVLHINPPRRLFSSTTRARRLWLQAPATVTMHTGRYLNGYEFRGDPVGLDRLVRPPTGKAHLNYASWKVNENRC